MCYRNEIKMKESNLQQRFYKMYQQTLKKKKKANQRILRPNFQVLKNELTGFNMSGTLFLNDLIEIQKLKDFVGLRIVLTVL